MDLVERLLGHDRWTTDHMAELSEDLTDDQLDRDFDIGHRTLRRTFDHIILTIEFWTGLMVGKPVPWEPRNASVSEMRERHTRAYDRFEAVARDLIAAGRLDESFVDHYDYPQSYGATILHVILHGQAHRSEVLHILQRLGKTELPEGDPQEWEHMTGRIDVATTS
jgi:uncharacterized damage-inducible protein DinB